MKNNNYWIKRLAKAFNVIESDVEFQLAKGYWKTLEDLINQLEDIYDVIIDEAVDGDILLSHLYQYDRYTQIINQINQKMLELGVKENSILENAFTEMYKEVSKIIAERYDLPELTTLTNEEIKERIKRVWTADGKSWSDRIWSDKDRLKKELTTTLTESLQTGKHTNEFAEELGNKLNASKGRAKTLLRTELAHTQEASALQRYKDAGVKYVKIKCGDYKRRIVYNGKGKPVSFYNIPCEACKEIDGKEFSVALEEIKPHIPVHP